MDEQTLISSRRALHGVAELILAGPQYRRGGGIRLRVVPGGFSTVAWPDLRVDGDQLIIPSGPLDLSGGTFAERATAAGVEASKLDDVYSGGPGIEPDDRIQLDPAAARLLADAFSVGDAALRALAPDEQPILWPEHFDVGITLDEVNYGVSPGDEGISTPYAYVGPWTPRTGDFWNAPFGASQLLSELPDAAAVLEFFRAGRDRAAAG
ncbi:hypothetical protein EV643_13049 [Kribbella sp. VKM Ac-2527]|jgi:hypothetical protein|uniref:Uncharacterized protein n=1 Tax=Kribbella caucasensis TaxID=2512215 RepID=A0A4R6JGV4_9ACTN|nr:hypothetical protein [Kribbella sp. VKM Ac-2527]TDO33866.1 hypothetical protein EV643_13049 [Kribbella sp. VKM Ac-2527]